MATNEASESPAEASSAGGYQVVARRYRPQRFADLVGQEHVARGLSGAIESGRVGHAYLFTGARGVGKTSAARIYAKALNCERGPAAEPCNACDACRAITAGQDVDVVEIDAASNRGIDEIRQLRQNVAVRPARGRCKVYIIDEVHMLTREAFNALLKTLEEPPGHVKFVFCTTEPEKLPITILSRCQRFDFVTVDAAAIARRLAQIVEAEGADVSAEALQLIARRAAGSMRDSQSLLEQLLGAASGPIGADDVHAVIGTGSEERIGELLTAVAERDAARAIGALDGCLAGGADPGGVMEQLLAAVRSCMLASVGCRDDLLADAEGLGVDVKAIGQKLGTTTILAMLQILDQALSRMRTSGHAGVLAEMAIVRLAALEDLESLARAVDRVVAAGPTASSGRPAIPTAPAKPTVAQPPAPAATSGPKAAPAAGPREKKTPDLTAAGKAGQDSSPPSVAAGPAPEAAPPPAATSGPLPAAETAWKQAGESLEGLAADFMDTAATVTWRDDLLEVSLPATAATAATFLRRPDSAAAITAALTAVVGRPIRHAIVVSEAADPEPPVPARRAPSTSQAALIREAAERPLVAHARTLFDAAIRKVEPPRRQAAAAAEELATTAAAAKRGTPPSEHSDG